MVSKRARVGRSLGTMIGDLNSKAQTADIKARTPDVDVDDLESRLSALESEIALLRSTNYRYQEDTPMWDARYKSQGTTAERDVQYGVPVTSAERVDLANRRVLWYNTEQGWIESYYTTFGQPGLTVPTVPTSIGSGWFPVGEGPWANLDAPGQARTAGQYTTNYYDWGNGTSNRKGTLIDRSPTVNPERLTLGLAGYYHITAGVTFPTGATSGVASLRSFSSTGSQLQVDQKPITLQSGSTQRHVFDLGLLRYSAGSYARFQTDSGSWTITVEFLTARYLGAPVAVVPPL